MARSLATIAAACLVATAACAAPSPGSPSGPPATKITAVATANPTPSSRPTRPPTPSPGPAVKLLESTYTRGADAPKGAIQVQLGTCCTASYEPTELTAKAGRVVIFLKSFMNKDFPLDHNMLIGPEIGTPIVKSPTLDVGETGLWVIEDVPAGEYAFWCSIDSHYEFGMIGTLTVTP